MFRVLSNEESHQVKKWRAPSLRDTVDTSNLLEGDSKTSIDSQGLATTDFTSLRHVVRDTHANAQSSNEDFTASVLFSNNTRGNHASLAVSNPSADMLQQTYDEGFSAGKQSCQAEAPSGTADTLMSLIGSLAPQKYQIDAAIEQELVSLAKAIAKLLLRREIESDDSIILDIVREALAQLPLTSETPTVILHPADISVIQSMQTPPELATLLPDSDMKRGDCRIHSGASILDAGVGALVESISSSDTQILPSYAEVDQAKPNITNQHDEQS
ncbi:MAG: FliH/SctL family protein [Granulosicoccaceae bacterium]